MGVAADSQYNFMGVAADSQYNFMPWPQNPQSGMVGTTPEGFVLSGQDCYMLDAYVSVCIEEYTRGRDKA